LTPADNVFYFNNDIDLRVCLKNAYTTMRTAWLWCGKTDLRFKDEDYQEILHRYTGHSGHGSSPSRYRECMKYQDIWNIPFRRGSYKIAIRRDPVERFKSAVSHLNRTRIHKDYSSEEGKEYIDLTHVTIDDIDKVLDAMDNQLIRDEHFFSQTYFMGMPNDYDKIYNLNEVGDLLKWVQKKCPPRLGVDITSLWANKTKDTESRITLTPEQTMRVIKFYAKDYANGWYY
tara:strand:+ start:1768 stop:2457 length:690 start_codon:yes stop_codon:yes gene_type:complete